MSIRKKFFLLLVLFALVLSSVGLCFADTAITDYPDGPVTFTEVPSNRSFYRIHRSALSTDASNPTLLFNDVYAYYTNAVYFVYDGVTSAAMNYGNGYIYLCSNNSSTFNLVSSTEYNLAFNTAPNSGHVLSFDGNPLMLNDIGIVRNMDATVLVGDSVVGEVVQFTLEPGYAYVIEGACEVSDRTFSLTGTSNLSALSNKNGSVQWFGSVGNIRDGFSPDLNNSENLVVWSPLNPNPSGEASNYSFHATDVINVSSGASYVITYPLYYGSKYVPTGASAVIQNSVNMSGSVYFEYSGDRPTMRRVALKSEQTFDDNFISYYNTFQPSVVNETVSFTVSDGVLVVDPSSAPAGGADAGTPSENVDNTILGVLQRFINNISGLISSGSHAIQELVTLGSSFMMSIAAMFQWLPSGLTTLILTAFTIVLVIGVIKLLWK